MLVATATLISLLIPLQIHSDNGLATQIINPLESLSGTSSVSQIKLAISYVAVKYGIEPSGLVGVVKCESGFDNTAKPPKSLNSAASGIAQFMPSTFQEYCQGDYYNIKDQIVCLAQMWSKGGQNNWSESKWCWSKYFTS